jgi:hypothetical protein
MEQMSGARRSGRLLAHFEEVAGDNGGEDAPNPAGAGGHGRRGGPPREEDSVEAEESGVDEEAEVPRRSWTRTCR